MNFEEAAQRYLTLRNQLAARQLSPQEFENLVANLRVQTTDGVWWQIRSTDGVWLRWNGATWEETAHRATVQPSVVQPSAPRVKQRKRSSLSCLKLLGIGALIFFCIVVGLGAGGYYLFSTGRFTTMQIAAALGPGMGEVQIINIADDTLNVRITRLDTEDGNPETVDSTSVRSMLVDGFGALEAGRYQVEFSVPSGVPSGGTCTLLIQRNDFYQFFAVPEGIVVFLDEQVPDDGSGSTIAESPLCHN